LGQGRLKDKPEVLDKLFEKLDANSDGFVTLEEFKKLAELREKFQEKKKQDKE
jgi:Ca2+-binding EF-hand superfamily protein